MTALLAMAVGADTPNAVKLIGAFISFAGVALVIAAGQGLDLGASLVGDVLTLVAAACWAVYTVFGATILRRHSPLMTTTWAIVAGTIFMAPLGIAQLATAEISGGLPELGPPDRPRAPLLGDARRGVRQRHRLPRREAARTDPGHRPPVPRPGPGGRRWPRSSSAKPIRPIQVVGGAIILAGVALLRRGSWPSGRRAARAIGGLAR